MHCLVVPPNITLVALPSKCPELNPVENIWQFMRENWLSNRIFTSYNDLLDHCCAAWNKLADQPWHRTKASEHEMHEAVIARTRARRERETACARPSSLVERARPAGLSYRQAIKRIAPKEC